MRDTYSEFRHARDRVAAAQNDAYKAFVVAFPIGSRVSYEHGQHTRYGEVIMHRYPPHCDVKIRSDFGAEMWIDGSRLGSNNV